MAIDDPKFHNHSGSWFWGCEICNPTGEENEIGYSLRRLRPLIHLLSEEELTAVIYKARWVDGIKDGSLCSDEAIAKAILKAIKEINEQT